MNDWRADMHERYAADQSMVDSKMSDKDFDNKVAANKEEFVTREAVRDNTSIQDADDLYQRFNHETPISGDALRRANNGEPGAYFKG